VRIEQHQEIDPMMHYVWLYEGPQWKQKAMAAGALIVIMAVVMFPLWPIILRQGVWYLSVGMMGLLGLFFAMSIFRLILFCVTVFVVPPGLWLFPNLFEDVGFFDSFKPVWGWQEVFFLFSPGECIISRTFLFANISPPMGLQSKKNKKKKSKKSASAAASSAKSPKSAAPSSKTVSKATSTATLKAPQASGPVKRDLSPRVEDVEED
jgi:translocation protein SEC62